MGARRRAKVTAEALGVDALAAAGEVVALAALVQRHADGEAFRALSTLTNDPHALAWLLQLGAERPALWNGTVSWPSCVPVPSGALRGKVEALFDPPSAGIRAVGAAAFAALLPRLDPVEFRSKIARKCLAPNTPEGPVREAARDALAGSSRPADRQSLRSDARSAQLPDRLVRLARLGPELTRPAERADVLEALQGLATAPVAVPDAALQQVREVAAMMDDEALKTWLAGTWVYPPVRTALMGQAFGERLGADRLCRLLDEQSSAEMVDLICGAAEGVPNWAGEAEVLVCAYGLGHKPAITHVRRFLTSDEVPDAVWQVVLAASERDVNKELGRAVQPSQLVEAARAHASDPRMVRVAASVAGTLADRDRETAQTAGPGEAWADTVVSVHETLGEPFITLLPDFLVETPIPSLVLDLALTAAAAIPEWAGCGFTAQIVDRAVEAGPAQADDVLGVLHDELDEEDKVRLLNTVTERGPELLDGTLRHLANSPNVVLSVAQDAVLSLRGPESGHASPTVLSALIPAALRAGLGHPHDTAEQVRALLEHPDASVNAAGMAWAEAIDVTADDRELVKVVVAADEAVNHGEDNLARLRERYGTSLADRAQHLDLPTDERVASLELAATTAPSRARDAAFSVLEQSTTPTLRRTAAGVLASTNGTVDEVARIQEIHDSEKRTDLRELLQTALHNVHSRDLTEAVAGLLSMLGLPPVNDPRVLVPYPSHENSFVDRVDKVRAASTNRSNPSGYGTQANVLADLLVDLAILAAHDAGTKKVANETEIGQIRANAKVRPDSGDLINRANLHAIFPWLGQCQALRDYRDAHFAPVDTLEPHRVTPDDSGAIASILQRLVAGWCETMRKHYNPSS